MQYNIKKMGGIMFATINNNRIGLMGRKRIETPEQKQAKANIIRLFNEYKRKKAREGIKVTHASVARQMGVKVGSVTQDLNEKYPVGVSASERWAQFLGLEPWDIHPGIKKPAVTNEKLMRSTIREVIDAADMMEVEIDADTIGMISSRIYVDCEKNEIYDIERIREKARTAIMFTCQQ